MNDGEPARSLADRPMSALSAQLDTLSLELLERIPPGAATILEVGCGAGILGAAYKRLNPRARVLGIEPDAAAARIAATRLNEVAVAEIDAASLPFECPNGIDCLIFRDVLPRLRDPWAALRKFVESLAPDGIVLATIPNVEHWSLTSRLLQGSWDYEDAGLLDRAHLRWFTLESARRALDEAGLVFLDSVSGTFDADLAKGFVAALAPALSALGADAQSYARRAAPLHYMLRASRRQPDVLYIVGTALVPVGGVSQVRVLDPLRSLSAEPGIVTMLSNGRELPDLDAEAPKVFILHRPAMTGPESLEGIRQILARDYVIVTEFDDHPDYIPILQSGGEVQNFRAVHAVQTSTEALADVLRKDNDEVVVFPNGIRALPDVRNFAQASHMTAFFGGLNRENDWPSCVNALNAVAAKVGSRLHFAIVHDRGLFDALETPYKTFAPTLDYPAYMDLLSRCELSFMPLSDTPFNRAKSDLKFLEAAACRVAALASEVVYSDTIQDGRSGILFRNPEELERGLLRLVADFGLARSLGDAARAWVAEHRMLAYQIGQRVAWYRSLWSRREELTEALIRRVPQLAENPD